MGANMMGARVRRIEDPRHLRGVANFVDDIKLPGILHAAMLRSPHAHARIRRIDLSAARAMPGVVDVFSLADGWADPPTIPVLVGVPSLLPCPQYPLARDRVRYVGEPVVVIVAETRGLAEDAMELVDVDYDPLPALDDCDAAQRQGATLLHDTVPGNMAARWTQGTGDVAKAFQAAEHVIRTTSVEARKIKRRESACAAAP